MNPMFKVLERKGFLKLGAIDTKKIMALQPSKIYEISQELCQASETLPSKPDPTHYKHIASLALSGSDEDCSNLNCRLQRLDELARFALVYSEHVYTYNFLAEYQHLEGETPPDFLRRSFLNDLSVLNAFRPLIDSGVIIPVLPAHHTCSICFAAEMRGKTAGERLQKAMMRLRSEYLAKTCFSLKRYDKEIMLNFDGPPEYIEHGGFGLTQTSLIDKIKLSPRQREALGAGNRVVISRANAKTAGLHNYLAQVVLSNITFELATADATHAAYVTNKELHINILNQISNDTELASRNQIAMEHLSVMLPFLDSIDLRSLMRLRARERDSFVNCKRAIDSAIDTFRRASGTFTAKEARQLHDDVIRPGLARLDRKLINAKKDLIATPIKAAAGVGIFAAMSFGLYRGFDLSAIAPDALKVFASSAIGGGLKFAKELVSLMDAKRSIREDDLYFLWQAKELPKGKRRVST